MLTFLREGQIEADVPSIRQLSRSKVAIHFGDQDREGYELYAGLCLFQDQTEQRCQVAFYARNLKRGLVFQVDKPSLQSPDRYAQDILSRLGFEQLERVDLKLKPAMLEVVLRDVPGFTTPAEARKQNQEKMTLLAELQATCEQDPESAEGKRAALKLSTDKRHQDRLQELLKSLEKLIPTVVNAVEEVAGLTGRLAELESKLTAAEALARAERRQREMSESVTAAAEKRIQELEDSLVDVETNASEVLKQQRKVNNLRGRVKELDGELETALQSLALEQDKLVRLSAETRTARENARALEGELKTVAATLEKNQALLAAERAEKVRLDKALKEAEQSCRTLREELERAGRACVRCDEAQETAARLQAELSESQQALEGAVALNLALDKEIEAAGRQNAALSKTLQQVEAAGRDAAGAAAQLAALVEQHEQLGVALNRLHGDYERECGRRAELEQGVAIYEQRIRALESELAAGNQSPVPATGEPSPVATTDEVETFKAALQQQAERLEEVTRSRDEMQLALHEAHDLIDSLEKMLRNTEVPAGKEHVAEAPPIDQGPELSALREQLKTAESQLAWQRAERDKLAMLLADTQKQLASLQETAPADRRERKTRRIPEPAVVRDAPVARASSPSAKPLPHELRPAPKKNALFHPDWDLQELPCRSAAQVDRVWESAFNVQISLEGYPSQYCMAYLIVLKRDGQKRLCMLYRLKQNKHTLICVPAKTPTDEASLQKAIAEALKFLKMSGFEMDELPAGQIDGTLGTYFQKA